MNVAEFAALLERYTILREREEFLFAQLGAIFINFGFSRPDRVISPEELMPSRVAEAQRNAPPIDPLDVIHRLDAFAAAHPEL